MKLQRQQKGFSLAEIVISMSLVVMISAIGFFSCVVAIRISSRSEAEAEIYGDVEKLELSLSSAYESVGGNENNFMKSLAGELEFYFEAKGLVKEIDNVIEKEFTEVFVPIKYAGEEDERKVVYSVSVRHERTYEKVYYRIAVKDSVHYTVCYINIENHTVTSANIKGYRTNSDKAVYEKAIDFARGEV